jgi:putative FmdB family regulatory protein
MFEFGKVKGTVWPQGVGLNCAWFKAEFRGHFLMPTYEYHCAKCDQNFEAFQSMRAKPFRECPKDLCRLAKWGHGKVRRLLGTGAGIIFKGSGFYATDYRSDSYKEAAKKESGKTAPEKPAETGKTEKKAAPSTTTPAAKGKKDSSE